MARASTISLPCSIVRYAPVSFFTVLRRVVLTDCASLISNGIFNLHTYSWRGEHAIAAAHLQQLTCNSRLQFCVSVDWWSEHAMTTVHLHLLTCNSHSLGILTCNSHWQLSRTWKPHLPFSAHSLVILTCNFSLATLTR